MGKGAIDLVVSGKAFEQLQKLERELEDIEKTIVRISQKSIGGKGEFSSITSKKSLNRELKKQSNILIQIAKNNKKYAATLTSVISKQKKFTREMKRGGDAAKKTGTRVGSFFKTLVQFDLARRGVQLFWDAFSEGFKALQTLDSISIQLKYLVRDSQEVLITQGFLARVSEDLGVEILKLSESYLAFRKAAELANLSAQDSRNVFEEVTKAASILGKSDAQIHQVQVALEQMLSKGTVQAEELKKQLGNVLPGAFEIMALAVQELNPDLDVTNREFGKMLKAGKIIAADVLPEFGKQLTKAYGVDNLNRVSNMKSEVTRLGNAFTNMIAKIESGTGALSKFILVATSILTAMVEEFGELFLTLDEINIEARKLNFEKGFKEGTEEANRMKKEVGEINDKLRTKVGWEITFENEKIRDTKKELLELEKTINDIKNPSGEGKPDFVDWITPDWFKSTGDATQDLGLLELKLKALNIVLGQSEGYVEGLTQVFKEIKKEIPEEEIEELTHVYMGLIPQLQRAKKALLEIQKESVDSDEILKLSQSMDALGLSIKFLQTGDVHILKDLTDEQLEPLLSKLKETNLETYYLVKNLRGMGNLKFDGIEDATEQIAGLTEKEQMLIDVLAAGADVMNSLADTINNVFEARIIDLEKEMDMIQEKYDLNKELIEQEIGDEESKAERLRLLAKEKEIADKVLKKKIAKEKEKQFRVDQAAAIATVGIQTAIGIISNLAAFPGPVGIALAALVAATGIASTIAIATEPVPKFAGGHLAGTHEGTALINDGGRAEVWEKSDGSLEMSSQRNRLINMSKGDRIHKSFDSFANQLPTNDIMKSLEQASIMASLNMNRNALEGVRAERSFQESLNGVLSREIKKGFGNVNINNDNSSVGRAVSQALSDREYENNFL